MDKLENMKTNETNETRETTFNSLTPDILQENKKVYTDALDFAFSHDDIRNIAITGVYGSGKSTVWNTYREYKSKNLEETTFKNIITVCLGKYEDNSKESNSVKDGKEKSVNNKEDKELDNRVERQIINQISAQINSNDIPLSKYKLKGNVSKILLWVNTVLTVLFSISIILLFYLKPIFKYLRELFGDLCAVIVLAVIFIILFIIPVVYYLFNFYKENKVKISRISYKGTEAQFTELNNDETVLERDMKEIVYLLSSSDNSIVVFEDLDRYDSVDIFVKLKELNYLLNLYLEANEKDRIVRFVYLIKDSLFYSKDRTKFFDFILPIVPVVDSSTSVDKINHLMKDVEKCPHGRILKQISLYVDDMRIIRNVVNEYKVYSNVLPMKTMSLNNNKLFSLIALKNTFPNEYQLLQEDRGYIKYVIDSLENYKNRLLDDISAEYELLQENAYESIDKSHELFKSLVDLIPVNLEFIDKDPDIKIEDFIKQWAVKKEEHLIRKNSIILKCTFNNLMKELDSSKSNELDLYIEKTKKIIDETNSLRKLFEKKHEEYGEVLRLDWKELLSKMSKEKKEEIFNNRDYNVVEHHYFPLIKDLFESGMLDEDYKYYMINYRNEESSIIEPEDIKFLKNLISGKKMNIFYKIKNPGEVINRMKLSDFLRFNGLNFFILKHLVDSDDKNLVINITQSVKLHGNCSELIEILNKLSVKRIEKYFDILLCSNKMYFLHYILKEWTKNENNKFKIVRNIISEKHNLEIDFYSELI